MNKRFPTARFFNEVLKSSTKSWKLSSYTCTKSAAMVDDVKISRESFSKSNESQLSNWVLQHLKSQQGAELDRSGSFVQPSNNLFAVDLSNEFSKCLVCKTEPSDLPGMSTFEKLFKYSYHASALT